MNMQVRITKLGEKVAESEIVSVLDIITLCTENGVYVKSPLTFDKVRDAVNTELDDFYGCVSRVRVTNEDVAECFTKGYLKVTVR